MFFCPLADSDRSLLLWAEAWSRNLELAHCITAHVEAKIMSNCYVLLCQYSSDVHAHPECLRVRLEWWKKVSQGCYFDKAFLAPLHCLLLSLFSRRIKRCGSTCLIPMFSQITLYVLVSSCTVVICPVTDNRCPRDLTSHLHSISGQKNRLSLGKPEHMVTLCPCANSIQPWTVPSCAGKWRQVPGKQSREQPCGRWGWQDCPGCDLLVHCTLSISGCCPSLVARGRSCVTPAVLG